MKEVPPTKAQSLLPPLKTPCNKRISVIEPQRNITSHHRATSVMLHGNIRVAANDIFLFPGAFVTSSSFVPMPVIDKELAVFGLNSAFVNTPEDSNVSIPKMASLYLAEIRS